MSMVLTGRHEVHDIVRLRGSEPLQSVEPLLTTSSLELVDGVIEAEELKAGKVAVRPAHVEEEAATLATAHARKGKALFAVGSKGSVSLRASWPQALGRVSRES